MSPIGRVFIVLNLLLAGTFVGFAGTYLQQANHWKELHGKKSEELAKGQSDFSAFRKNSLDNNLANSKVTTQHLEEDNTRLQKQLAKIEADVTSLTASANAQREENKAAFATSAKNFELTVNAQK